MSAAGSNFLSILRETIKRAGVEGDSAGRAAIYARARRTVIDRAEANDSESVENVQRDMDAAIAIIESDLGGLPTFPASATTIAAMGGGGPLGRSQATVGASQGGAALAVALPDAETAPPQTTASVSKLEPRMSAPAVETEDDDEEDSAENRSAVSRFKQNVFPIWRKLKAPLRDSESTEPETSKDSANGSGLSPSQRSEPGARILSPYKLPTLGRSGDASADADTQAAVDAAYDRLDRVAADIAAGFREPGTQAEAETGSRSGAAATNREEVDPDDEFAMSEPGEALARDVGNLVQEPSHDVPSRRMQALAELRRIGRSIGRVWTSIVASLSAYRPRLPQLTHLPRPDFTWRLPALPRVFEPNLAMAGVLALLVLGVGAYFALNPRPADPVFAAPEPIRLIPDAKALDGEGWVARDVEVEAVYDASSPAFSISDTAMNRFGTLAAPLNDAAAPEGFRVTVRLMKSDKRLPHFAAVRVTAPFSRRAYTMDAMIDLSTGEAKAGGRAKDEDISVIDDGDAWRLTLIAPLEGNILFSKPRLEIFPAAGAVVGSYDAAAMGGITVGSIQVEKL